MQKIYNANNFTDANLIKGLLSQFGIEATVNGFYLQGGIGELPTMDLISVSVNDKDTNKALTIIREFETATLDDNLDLEKLALESQDLRNGRLDNSDKNKIDKQGIDAELIALSHLIRMMIGIGIVFALVAIIFYLRGIL